MSSINRAYAKFDAAIERRFGADVRLLYGFGAPVVLMGVLIGLGIAFAASTVTVAVLMVLEVVMLVVVVIGFTRLLSEPGGSSDQDE